MNTKRIGVILALGAALAMNLVGCKNSSASAATPTDNSNQAAKMVKITVGEGGFSPSSVTVNKGQKLMLLLTRVTDNTCAKKVVFPELSLSKDLPLNSAVSIDIPTDEARKLTFQCGLGMYKGTVVIL